MGNPLQLSPSGGGVFSAYYSDKILGQRVTQQKPKAKPVVPKYVLKGTPGYDARTFLMDLLFDDIPHRYDKYPFLEQKHARQIKVLNGLQHKLLTQIQADKPIKTALLDNILNILKKIRI